MKNVALRTKFHVLLRSIGALMLAIAIASVACADAFGGSPAIDLNQHGLAGTGYPPALMQNVFCSATAPVPRDPGSGLSGNWLDDATSGQGLAMEVNIPIGSTPVGSRPCSRSSSVYMTARERPPCIAIFV